MAETGLSTLAVPAHLDDRQAAVWLATAGRVGVPVTPDVLTDLEAFCIESCRRDAAERHLQTHGDVLILRNDRGDVTGTKEAPELRIARSARAEADRLAERLKLQASEPVCKCGATSTSADGSRCSRGHVLTGNGLAVVTGSRSVQFWRESEAALDALAAGILADRGHSPEDAPVALRLAAKGAAQAALVRDAAYTRMIETGGPLSGSDRERGAHRIWAAASDRVLRHSQAIGYDRAAARVPSLAEVLRGEVAP